MSTHKWMLLYVFLSWAPVWQLLKPVRPKATNNLAVLSLYNEGLTEAITLLYSLFDGGDASAAMAFNSDPLIHNLATLLEIKSDYGQQAKVDLLARATGWMGDGVRPESFKV
jgi:uncharacterized membrane protein